MTNISVAPPKVSEPITDERGIVSKSWYRFMTDLWRRTGGGTDLVSSTSESLEINSPAGAILLWTVAAAPTGWLVCNGSAVSRATYAALFATIGTTYGAGDGSSTFNLPDLRDRLPIGLGTAIVTSVGATGGSATKTIAQGNLPNYALTVSDAGHTHTFTGTAHNHAITDAGHTHTTAAHSHTVAGGNFVTDAAGTEYVNTAGNKGATQASTASATVTVNSATTGITVNNTTATGTNASNTTGITVASGGSGTALNVMNPHLCLQFIIKI